MASSLLLTVLALCAVLSVGSRAYALALGSSIKTPGLARTGDMLNPRLASNLDELLGLSNPNEVQVERLPSRYDIVFRKGSFQIRVSIFFESQTYQVDGSGSPVDARSLEDVWNASALFREVETFLSTINPLGVRDIQVVAPVVIHRAQR